MIMQLNAYSQGLTFFTCTPVETPAVAGLKAKAPVNVDCIECTTTGTPTVVTDAGGNVTSVTYSLSSGTVSGEKISCTSTGALPGDMCAAKDIAGGTSACASSVTISFNTGTGTGH